MVSQLQADLQDLTQARTNALDELERLRHDLTLTVDVDEAERISTRINALETVSGNLDERISAKQQAIADAEKSAAGREMQKLAQKRRELATAALDGLRDALDELDAIVSVSDDFANAHWKARSYPDTSKASWMNRRDTLGRLIVQLDQDLS